MVLRSYPPPSPLSPALRESAPFHASRVARSAVEQLKCSQARSLTERLRAHAASSVALWLVAARDVPQGFGQHRRPSRKLDSATAASPT
jgi:hypothetical protein